VEAGSRKLKKYLYITNKFLLWRKELFMGAGLLQINISYGEIRIGLMVIALLQLNISGESWSHFFNP